MRDQHLKYLCCPACRSDIRLIEAHFSSDHRVETGKLACDACAVSFPIVRHVPRFVEDEGCNDAFGLQWSIHRRTQYDTTTGRALSSERFFGQTGWPPSMGEELLLEAGCGSGRFTEPALDTGAMVLSFDHSRAVDSNYASNGHRSNLLLVQGDLFHLPFRHATVDRVFCFGVLQHTSDPRAALGTLTLHVKPGGQIAVDIYAKTIARYVFGTKYWVRPLTTRMSPQRLHDLVAAYVAVMWPIASQTRRIPLIGKPLTWRLLVADHSDELDDDETLKEWAVLDTFDMLAPRYDNPASARAVRRWASELGLTSVRVCAGANGFELTATRAAL